MQTGIWMAYSDSTHCSDKFSYKILCISSYRLKDMNIARYTLFLQFLAKQKIAEAFLTEGEPSPGH
jgi:hypothetical protein